jgi:hypothetical protein
LLSAAPDGDAPSGDSVWLEVWREGNTAYAAIYTTDPATGAEPVLTSTCPIGLAGTPYAAGETGYFGIVIPWLSQAAGIDLMETLVVETTDPTVDLGLQAKVTFAGPSVNVTQLSGDGGAQVEIAPIVSGNEQAADYTLAFATDGGLSIDMDVASACTVTIPVSTDDDAFAEGTIIEVCQAGAGQVEIVGEGGVTIKLPPGATAFTVGENATVRMRQQAINTWVLSGGLAS